MLVGSSFAQRPVLIKYQCERAQTLLWVARAGEVGIVRGRELRRPSRNIPAPLVTCVT